MRRVRVAAAHLQGRRLRLRRGGGVRHTRMEVSADRILARCKRLRFNHLHGSDRLEWRQSWAVSDNFHGARPARALISCRKLFSTNTFCEEERSRLRHRANSSVATAPKVLSPRQGRSGRAARWQPARSLGRFLLTYFATMTSLRSVNFMRQCFWRGRQNFWRERDK